MKEVTGDRWEYGKCFHHEQTSCRTYIVHSKPVHFWDAGRWHEVDTNWQLSSRPGFAYEMVAAGYQVWAAQNLRATPFLVVRRRGVEKAYTLGDVIWKGRWGQRKKVANLPNASVNQVRRDALLVKDFVLKGVTLQVIADPVRPVVLAEVGANALEKITKWDWQDDQVPALTVDLVPYSGGVWGAMLGVATNYPGETADGEIYGQNNGTYATARSTSTATDTASTTLRVGQNCSGGVIFTVYRGYLSFDTSAIADSFSVETATLYVCADYDLSSTDFLVKVYRFAWAEALGGGNQEANYDGAYGGSATLEGTLQDTATAWTAGTYYSLAVTPAGVNKTGDTKYTLVSSRDVDGTQPSGNEYVFARTADYAGTGSDPYMAITVAPAGYAAIF